MSQKIKLLRIKNLPSANQHYTTPFKEKEVVEYKGELEPKEGQPESFTKQFIKIFRMRTGEVMVESRKDFQPIGWSF